MIKREILAELIYALLVLAAISATWYDLSVSRDQYISIYVNRYVHNDPVIAFLGGVLTILLTWLVHKAWDIKFHYVIALVALGFCLGHLFWSLPKQ